MMVKRNLHFSAPRALVGKLVIVFFGLFIIFFVLITHIIQQH